ncbi:reverse transcriptase-like protein [Nymphaea thermarum]|nr:reverse transcriptase-like protein [Nymphaea thermarum]
MSVISHACVRTLMRQPSFGFLPACGTAGGILLAWSPPLTGAIVHVGRYSISASLNGFWPNGPVLVTAVYGPCVGALRGQLWAELLLVRQVVASPWQLVGDFNCLLSPADSSSPVTSGPSMSAFRSFVEEFGLFDVPSTNGTFTWSNNRNPLILRRLYHIFLSPELFSAFPPSSLVLGLRHLSDHAPLLLSLLRGRAGIGHARFRFELWWLRDESFVATVPNWWARAVNGRWATFRLSRKLHSIRREALAWKRIFWSSKFLEVAAWDEEILSLQTSDNISADQSSRLICLQCLAEEWRIRESIHWQQRSRLGWLAHGDHNYRFFHLTASQRRRQTLLQSLLIGGRVFLGDDILPALSAHFRDFYFKPFRFRVTLPDFHLSSLSVSCAIDRSGAALPPTRDQERGLGPWLGADVFVFCDEFASNSVFLKEFNQAICVLVPKRPNPTDVTHFRPISILGAPYKIIAKLLSLRLAPVMPSVINPFQCGDFFCLERGLRQGCPLSPLLFNLVAESFSALFHHATVVGFLTPHSLPHLPSFSTIQYADDFLLFGGASHQQIVRTWLILRVFEFISALSINSAKCHLFLIHADPATVLLAEACFGCKATSLPMDYLGLQIMLSSPAPSFWDGLEQKLIDRLQCWQGKLLSLPGRITLARHCLASVPLHALSVFRPPVAVLRRFDKLIRKFVWDGDRHSDRLAHWNVVAFPRLLGGAGVTNLSRTCEFSLCFWWWRLATEYSPITQFISSKFDLPSPSIWHSSISHPSPSHFWSGMLSVLPLFLHLADLSSSTSPSWSLSPTREFTFSSCYLASFGPSVASLPSRSLCSPGPSPRVIAFVWLPLTGHINTFDLLQRLGISLANQCPLCLVATESRVHLFTSTWPSLVSSLPNSPSIRLLFLFCLSPRLTASWGHVWRP